MASQQHGEAFYAKTNACRWRHTVLEGAQEIIIYIHSFFIAAFHQSNLFFKTFALVDGIIQFGVSVGYFLTVYDQLKTLYQSRFAAVLFSERAHFYRVVGNESRLYIMHL